MIIVSKRQKEGLAKTIRHWEKAHNLYKNLEEPVHGSESCLLCKMYNCREIEANNCLHCPIMLKTKKHYCKKTPYDPVWLHNKTAANHTRMITWMKKLYAECKVKK